MIREDYEQFLTEKGLYKPQKPKIGLAIVYRNPFFKTILKVASVVLFFGTTFWLVQKPTTPSVSFDTFEEIVDNAILEKEPVGETRMGLEDEMNRAYFRNVYNVGKFEDAIIFLEKIPKKNEHDLLYLGLCSLYKIQPNYPQAIDYLNKTIEMEEGKGEKAFWYLALIQIKIGDKKSAKQSLKKLLDLDQMWKREEAMVLLKKISE
jgi:tetratricopeptide (TPR) repeat protein